MKNYREFLFYNYSIKKEIKKYTSGTSVLGISRKNIKKINVFYPEIKEQEKIAEILSTWDEAIELKERLLEKKRLIKKGLMQRLLTGDVRLDGFDGEWEEVRLGDIVNLITGKRPKGGVDETGDIPSLGGENIKQNYGMKYDSIKKVSFNFANNLKKGILKNEDILLNKDGASTGKLGLYKKKFDFATINEHLYIIRFKEGINKYLYYKLCSNHIQNNLKALITGAAQPGLNRKSLNSLKLKIPKLKEQKAIADILNKADEFIDLLEKEIDKLKEQKKGLMQLLLTGKVRTVNR